VEGLEDSLQLAFRNPNSSVFDNEPHGLTILRAPPTFGAQPDPPTGLCEFHGISKEIEQYLSKYAFIRGNRREGIAPHRDIQGQLGIGRAYARETCDVLEKFLQIYVSERQLEFTCLNLGKIQQIVDEFQQVLARSLDDRQTFTQFLG
jgi:hypothetical protein